jgi:hypothetical protein
VPADCQAGIAVTLRMGPTCASGLTTKPVTYAPSTLTYGSNGSLQELFAAGSGGAVWSTNELLDGHWNAWNEVSPFGLTTMPVTYAPVSNGTVQELFATGSHGAIWNNYELPGLGS